MSVWRSRCLAVIVELVADLPADATLAERRKALRGKGYPAHQGTVWGRKMWGQEVRKYLQKHGAESRVLPMSDMLFPAHIHFPFRDQHGA